MLLGCSIGKARNICKNGGLCCYKEGKRYVIFKQDFEKNVTLEQYFILQKIEKVKELLLYNEFSLTEISQKLGYKSVQHLSAQFKNTTGFTPTLFKKLELNERISLDLV